jgi:hypothetical protein
MRSLLEDTKFHHRNRGSSSAAPPYDDDVTPIDCPQPHGSPALQHGERAALRPLSIDQDVPANGNDGKFRSNAGQFHFRVRSQPHRDKKRLRCGLYGRSMPVCGAHQYSDLEALLRKARQELSRSVIKTGFVLFAVSR